MSNLITYTADELLELDFHEDGAPILGDWLLKQRYSLVCARRFTGKSWLAMGIAIAVAGGGTLFDWSADIPRKVLLVDGELSRGQLQRNYLHLIKAVDLRRAAHAGANLMVYPTLAQKPGRFHPLETAKGQADVLKVASGFGAELVILDNIKALTRLKDRNSDSQTEPFLDLIDTLKGQGATVLGIHHSSAKSKNPVDPCMGAGSIGDRADSILALYRSGPEDGELRSRLKPIKARDGQDMAPMMVHLSKDTGKWDWRYLNAGPEATPEVDPEVAEALTLFKEKRHTTWAQFGRDLGGLSRAGAQKRLERAGVAVKDAGAQFKANKQALKNVT